MSRLLNLTGAAILCLTAAVIGFRVVGSLDPVPAAVQMLDANDCHQPCWHGIRPGWSVITDISKILRTEHARLPSTFPAIDSTELCWEMSGDQPWRGCVHRHWSTDWGTPISSLELAPQSLRLG